MEDMIQIYNHTSQICQEAWAGADGLKRASRIYRTGEAEIPSCTWAEVASAGGGMRESTPVSGGGRGGNQRSIPIIYAA